MKEDMTRMKWDAPRPALSLSKRLAAFARRGNHRSLNLADRKTVIPIESAANQEKTLVIPTKPVLIENDLVIPTKPVVIKKEFVIPTEGRNLLFSRLQN